MKEGWNQIEKVQKEYFKDHFMLPQRTSTANIQAELGISSVQIKALIATIQFVQELQDIPSDQLPNLAMHVSKDMDNVTVVLS